MRPFIHTHSVRRLPARRLRRAGVAGLLAALFALPVEPAHAIWWGIDPSALTFQRYLVAEYITAAGFEDNDATDLSDARMMRERAVAAQQGNRVWPLLPEDVRLVRSSEADLTTNRNRLMRVLENPTTLQRYPHAAAKAQVAYDCWALHQQAEPNASHNLYPCENSFHSLIEALDPPAIQTAQAPVVMQDAVRYDVVTTESIMFGWDQDTLTPTAKMQLDRVRAALHDEANPVKKLVLQGFADRSGGVAYNQALSERRVRVVANYLGVDPADTLHIDLTAFGETNLPIATADGVREAGNRLTTVAIVKESVPE